jgi:CheY-like chemotaxis protein
MRPELPILYMTGYSRNAVVHHGRLDEGVELLQKPVSQAQLAAQVRRLLDRPRGLNRA